jgi:hypothetical protein
VGRRVAGEANRDGAGALMRWICRVRFEGTALLIRGGSIGSHWERTQWSPEQEARQWGQYTPEMIWRQDRDEFKE